MPLKDVDQNAVAVAATTAPALKTDGTKRSYSEVATSAASRPDEVEKKPKTATDTPWANLTVKDLRRSCKARGLKMVGAKADLVERLKNPVKTDFQTYNSSALTSIKAVNAALKKLGLDFPDRLSACARKAIQNGHFSIADGLDKAIFTSVCVQCGENLHCTLRDVLHQPDYEKGSPEGALQCENCHVGYYLTKMCTGEKHMDSGKGHHHCVDCPGLGTCMDDYREVHCTSCDQHYFGGSPGLPCPHCHPSIDASLPFFDPFDDGYGVFDGLF